MEFIREEVRYIFLSLIIGLFIVLPISVGVSLPPGESFQPHLMKAYEVFYRKVTFVEALYAVFITILPVYLFIGLFRAYRFVNSTAFTRTGLLLNILKFVGIALVLFSAYFAYFRWGFIREGYSTNVIHHQNIPKFLNDEKLQDDGFVRRHHGSLTNWTKHARFKWVIGNRVFEDMMQFTLTSDRSIYPYIFDYYITMPPEANERLIKFLMLPVDTVEENSSKGIGLASRIDDHHTLIRYPYYDAGFKPDDWVRYFYSENREPLGTNQYYRRVIGQAQFNVIRMPFLIDLNDSFSND